MSTKRPRRWVSLDVDYLTRPRIVALRQAFGAAGPLTLLAIILECDKTERGRQTDTVEMRYSPIAQMVGATADEVRRIVETAESLRLLSLDQERDAVTGRKADRVTLLERSRWAPKPPPHWRASDTPKRISADERLIAGLSAAGPLGAEELADQLGLTYAGSFRARLKRLRDAGRIVLNEGAYSVSEGG